MRFTKQTPQFTSGLIWYVETEYPIPKVGFWTSWNNRLYQNTSCTEYFRSFKGIRFGDQIIPPVCSENIVEQ